jgi:hypothetical protein
MGKASSRHPQHRALQLANTLPFGKTNLAFLVETSMLALFEASRCTGSERNEAAQEGDLLTSPAWSLAMDLRIAALVQPIYRH